MSRTFQLRTRDPRDAGYKVYKHTKFTIEPGLTVLTGCNGAGKSSLIYMIEQDLKENNILYTKYDNLHDGGSTATGMAMHNGDIELFASLALSSEGESINCNLSSVFDRLNSYSKTLDPKDLISRGERFAFIFNKPTYKTNQIWILLDAADSGLSIDGVIIWKRVIHHFIDILNEKGKEVYIVIAANEYEMCADEKCFDVQNMKYRIYKTYKAYKTAILRSAEYKHHEQEKARLKREEKETKHGK